MNAQINTINKVSKIIKEIYSTANMAIEYKWMFIVKNDCKIFQRYFDSEPETFGLNSIHHALLTSWILILCRLLDPEGSDRASIPVLFKLLQEKGIKDYFVEEALAWPGSEDYNRQLVLLPLQEMQDVIISNKARIADLKKYRDYVIAHNLHELKKNVRLIYGVIPSLHEEIIPIIYRIHLGLTGISTDYDDIEEGYSENAKKFWRFIVKAKWKDLKKEGKSQDNFPKQFSVI